jgi:hypothetical protein
MRSLPFLAVEANMKKYGKRLVANLPDATTELLKALCTGRYRPVPLEDGMQEGRQDMEGGMDMPTEHADMEGMADMGAEGQLKARPEEFIHLYVNHSAHLRSFLQHMVSEEPSSSKLVGNTLLELLLRPDDDDSNGSSNGSKEEPWVTNPDQYPGEEAYESSNTSNTGNTDSTGATDAAADKQQRENEVWQLLDNPRVKYDNNHALCLVQVHGFRRGQLYLYEKLHMYHMVVQVLYSHTVLILYSHCTHTVLTCTIWWCSTTWRMAIRGP